MHPSWLSVRINTNSHCQNGGVSHLMLWRITSQHFISYHVAPLTTMASYHILSLHMALYLVTSHVWAPHPCCMTLPSLHQLEPFCTNKKQLARHCSIPSQRAFASYSDIPYHVVIPITLTGVWKHIIIPRIDKPSHSLLYHKTKTRMALSQQTRCRSRS